MKEVCLSDHLRLIGPAVLSFVGIVIIAAFAGFTIDRTPGLIFYQIQFGVFLVAMTPIVVMHVQYWKKNGNMSLVFKNDCVSLYRGDVFEVAIDMLRNVSVDKFVTSSGMLHMQRYYYYIISSGEHEYYITSLLPNAQELEKYAGSVHESLFPFIE